MQKLITKKPVLLLALLLGVMAISFAGCSYPDCSTCATPADSQACGAGGSGAVDPNAGGGGLPGVLGGSGGQIAAALLNLCSLVKNVLGVGMMFMVVASALVYSIGQVMGAETRARASVWATSMFNGAIIAALIYLLVPFVLRTMLPALAGQIAC